MTLAKQGGPLGADLVGPPEGATLLGVIQWVYDLFIKVLDLQQQPRPQSIVMAKLESPQDAEAIRPEEGMLVYAANQVLGTSHGPGLYFYGGGQWRPVVLIV